MSAAAIKATFSDFRVVKTRGVCQLILEVPLEAADAALITLGGLPRPDQERWVGVARLGHSEAGVVVPERYRQAFHELPMSQQAAIKCDDARFQKYMRAEDGADCAHRVREACGVASRADIKPDTPAGYRWVTVLRGFEGYR